MKVWIGYSSEHSSRIALVGHFETPELAKEFLGEYQKVQELAVSHFDECQENQDKFPDEIMRLLYNRKIKFTQVITPGDFLEFGMEAHVTTKGKDFVLTSNEYDWGGTVKMLLMANAKIEVLSRHRHQKEYDEYTSE